MIIDTTRNNDILTYWFSQFAAVNPSTEGSRALPDHYPQRLRQRRRRRRVAKIAVRSTAAPPIMIPAKPERRMIPLFTRSNRVRQEPQG